MVRGETGSNERQKIFTADYADYSDKTIDFEQYLRVIRGKNFRALAPGRLALGVAELLHRCRDLMLHLPLVGFFEGFESEHAFGIRQFVPSQRASLPHHPINGLTRRPLPDPAHDVARRFFEIYH